MEHFKKVLRLLIFIIIIALATIGIGISGGVPIPTSFKRENRAEMNIELKESDEEENVIDEEALA
ncbi:MAG: hypothetical protein MI974_10605 [Chitinophagales bacterium]|nr:hypothetical protein [Chitinophagales bacterium]